MFGAVNQSEENTHPKWLSVSRTGRGRSPGRCQNGGTSSSSSSWFVDRSAETVVEDHLLMSLFQLMLMWTLKSGKWTFLEICFLSVFWCCFCWCWCVRVFAMCKWMCCCYVSLLLLHGVCLFSGSVVISLSLSLSLSITTFVVSFHFCSLNATSLHALIRLTQFLIFSFYHIIFHRYQIDSINSAAAGLAQADNDGTNEWSTATHWSSNQLMIFMRFNNLKQFFCFV